MTERDPATIWTPPEATGGTPGRGRLAARRILVVGAGTQPSDDADAPLGNGRAISILCAREGASVACADRDAAGLAGLCRHVALEGSRRGIRANLVVPGLIDTPLGRVASQGRPSRAATAVPLGRQGTAWEVAYATVFLLGGESSYVTGQQLVVDGGLSSLR